MTWIRKLGFASEQSRLSRPCLTLTSMLPGALITGQLHYPKIRSRNVVVENNYTAEASEIYGFTGSHAAGPTMGNR